MKNLATTVLLGLGILTSNYASAGQNMCSVKALAGEWVYATDVGQQMLGDPLPPGKDITSIGRITIHRDGTMTSIFDVTIQDAAFFKNATATGSVVVNRDCTGEMTFVTSAGTERTDTIVIVNSREFFGMSQDPFNLWNYQARKISRRIVNDDD